MSTIKTPKPSCKESKSQHVQVFVRVRPLNDSEISHKSQSAVTVKGPKEVIVNDHTTPKISKTYTFDGVFGPNAEQSEIYQRVVAQSVCDVLAGFNCTVFAYGQTGSGKTYTMEGDFSEGDQSVKAGLIPRAMSALFDELRLQKAEFVVRISFIELYNEELYDLFTSDDIPPKLRIFDDPAKKGTVLIQPLEEVPVHTKNQVMEILKKGLAKRQVAATQMNAHSSRSHTVFFATVHLKENNVEAEELVKFGRLYLVDLAGSENISKSGSVDKRAREAGNINQSLLTLGRVINSLVERQPHIPYRESKLTRVLQDSLGGRTKTSIIATVSPAASNVEETISTLDYAHKAKSVNNRPEVNQRVSKEDVMKEYTVLIEDLTKKLNLAREGSGIYLAHENYKACVDRQEKENRELVEKIAEIRVCTKEISRYERLFDDLSGQLHLTEKRLDDVQQDLGKTRECVVQSQTLLMEQQGKLAETIELVEKADHYKHQVHSQAETLISIVDECQANSAQFHMKLEKSRATEINNTHYARALVQETDRLRDSFFVKTDEFVTAAASLQSIVHLLLRLKDEGDEEVKALKDLVSSRNAQSLSTLKKIVAARQDQENYKRMWDDETSAETSERCAQRVDALNALEGELTTAFESYRELLNSIGEIKSSVAGTVHDCLKDWLDIVEKTVKTSQNSLNEARALWQRQISQGEQALKKIESSTNGFCVQEEKFEKEKSKAIGDLLLRIADLERMVDDHNSAGVIALAKCENNVKEAGDFVATFEPVLKEGANVLNEETSRGITDVMFGARSLRQAVSAHSAEVEPRITNLRTTLLEIEATCDETCSDNASAWATLATDTADAVKARKTESTDTRQKEDKYFEEIQKDLAELDRKYADVAEKIQERYRKFKEESGCTLDRVSSVTEAICTDLKEQLRTTSTLVQTFVHDQFKRDCPTGETPPRKEMRIPPLKEPLDSPDVRRIVRKVYN